MVNTSHFFIVESVQEDIVILMRLGCLMKVKKMSKGKGKWRYIITISANEKEEFDMLLEGMG